MAAAPSMSGFRYRLVSPSDTLTPRPNDGRLGAITTGGATAPVPPVEPLVGVAPTRCNPPDCDPSAPLKSTGGLKPPLKPPLPPLPLVPPLPLPTAVVHAPAPSDLLLRFLPKKSAFSGFMWVGWWPLSDPS